MFIGLLTATTASLFAQLNTAVLFANGPKKQIKVSPDGKKIVFLSLENGVYQVFKEHINGGDVVQLSGVKGPDVSQAEWVDDETVVFLHESEMNGADMLYSVNLSDATPRLISPQGRDVNILGCDIKNSTVLFELRAESGFNFDLCSFDKKYKSYQTIQKNNGSISWWGVTANGQLMCWVENNAEGTRLIGFSGGNVQKLFNSDSRIFMQPIAPSTSHKGAYLLLTDFKRKGLQLLSFSLATGEELAEDHAMEGTTIESLSISNTDGRILELGIRNLNDGSIEYTSMDSKFSEITKEIYSRLTVPGRLSFSNSDQIENVWIFEVIDDYGRVNTIRYNKANKEVKLLAGDMVTVPETEAGKPSFNQVSKGNSTNIKPLRRESRNPLFDIDISQLAMPAHSIFQSECGLTIPLSVYSPAEITAETFYVLHIHGGLDKTKKSFNGLAQYLLSSGIGLIDFDLSYYRSSLMLQGAETWLKAIAADIPAIENWISQQGLAKERRMLVLAEGIGAFSAMEPLLQGKFYSKNVAILNPVSDLNAIRNHPECSPDGRSWWLEGPSTKAFQPLPYGAANRLSTDILVVGQKTNSVFSEKQIISLHKNLSNNSLKTAILEIPSGTVHTPSEKGNALIADELITFFMKAVKSGNDIAPVTPPTRK
jgi:hypothetical protein